MNDEAVVRKYGDMVYKIAFNYVRQRFDADDVFSEVFLTFFKKRRVFESEEHRKAWFIRVTINCAKDHISSAPKYEDIDSLAIEQQTFTDNRDPDLEAAMKALSEEDRNIIYLFYYEDLTIRQIAQALSMNENTVKTRLSRSKEKLRQLMEVK